MKFNIGMLAAFVATSQIASAAPVKWNDKSMEGAYKCAAVASGATAALCNHYGSAAGTKAGVGIGLGSSAAAAAVTVSQSPAGIAAGKKISAGAGWAKCKAGEACAAAGRGFMKAGSAIGRAGSKAKQSVTGGHQRPHDVEMGHHRRSEGEVEYRQLATREPEPEAEFESIQAREPEPEPSWNELN